MFLEHSWLVPKAVAGTTKRSDGQLPRFDYLIHSWALGCSLPVVLILAVYLPCVSPLPSGLAFGCVFTQKALRAPLPEGVATTE